MASKICSGGTDKLFNPKTAKNVLDMHCGGEDLKFPHHDNELAQSEAFFNNGQWVNYFLHSGHLKIEGREMSKSKKNFITIRESLESYNFRQIRLLYLLHNYWDQLDYAKDTMKDAVFMDKFFQEFFQNVKSMMRDAKDSSKGFCFFFFTFFRKKIVNSKKYQSQKMKLQHYWKMHSTHARKMLITS